MMEASISPGYVIAPLYKIFPKPGELNDLVVYILTDENTLPMGGPSRDLRSARQTIDVSGIVTSNLAFLAVVVGHPAVSYVAARKTSKSQSIVVVEVLGPCRPSDNEMILMATRGGRTLRYATRPWPRANLFSPFRTAQV